MKIAIVHFWLTGMRGGEKVLEEILRIYPDADLYTNVFVPEQVSEIIKNRKVFTTFINKLPYAKKIYHVYLPFMPLALKRLDLRKYDLVISSESGPAKGVITKKKTLHICYCHSPMRYIWDIQDAYLKNASIPERIYLRLITPYMREWDRKTSGYVDYFVTNSENVKGRIKRIYNRSSITVHPPVDVSFFRPVEKKGKHFVLAGKLAHYKRPDIAVEAFSEMKLPLKVIGSGPMFSRLKKIGGRNIEFLGRVDDETFREIIATSRALIFPGEEDFGIIPLEAQAAGVPVIAYERGGVLESINGLRPSREIKDKEGYTGLFFGQQTVQGLKGAVRWFIENESVFNPDVLRRNAERFTPEVFRQKFKEFVDEKINNHLKGSS